jgi:membrane protease YdiL (CAAX protease family)
MSTAPMRQSALENNATTQAKPQVWHVSVVLAVIAGMSLLGFIQHSPPYIDIPGLNFRLSGYLTIITIEWLLVLFIRHAQHQQGESIAGLAGGSWPNWRSGLKDFGLAISFLLVGMPVTSALAMLAGTSSGMLRAIPATPTEAVIYVLLCLTAGYCEELIFRGFLLQRFWRWTGSRTLAILLQGLAFGLAHGYQEWRMAVIILYGCMFGGLALWRKNLLPGMLAHGIQDTVGGLLAFFLMPITPER